MSRRRLFEVLSIIVLLLFGGLFLIQIMSKSSGNKWSSYYEEKGSGQRSNWIVQHVLQTHSGWIDYYIGCDASWSDPVANFFKFLGSNKTSPLKRAGFKKKGEKDYRISTGWSSNAIFPTVESMKNEEISSKFGIAGLAIIRRVGSSDKNLLDEGARMLRTYYNDLFLLEPLQVHLEYSDDQGDHVADAEVNFGNIASARDELFRMCNVKNPY